MVSPQFINLKSQKLFRLFSIRCELYSTTFELHPNASLR